MLTNNLYSVHLQPGLETPVLVKTTVSSQNNDLESMPITNNCTLRPAIVNDTITASILIDSGADKSYMNKSFCKEYCFDTQDIPACTVKLADGESLLTVNSTTTISLWFHDHIETELNLLVGAISGFDIILGKDWLNLHNPSIDWTKDTIAFDSVHCKNHCTKGRSAEDQLKLEKELIVNGDEDIIKHMQQKTCDLEETILTVERNIGLQ